MFKACFIDKIVLTKGNKMETKSELYVVHDCKNTKKPEFLYTKDENGKIISKVTNPEYCNNAWIDIDKTNCKTYPPAWKYCDECVAKGYKNPKTRVKKQTPEQIELFKKRMAEYRLKKSNLAL